MKYIALLSLAALFTSAAGAAAPDCQVLYHFTNRVGDQGIFGQQLINQLPGISQTFDNRSLGCSAWTFSYDSEGFSAVNITLQSAAATLGGASTFSAFAGTVVSGANPQTATTSGNYQATGYYPYMAVQLTSFTGTGSINATLIGYKSPAYVGSVTSVSGCTASGSSLQKGNGSGGCAATSVTDDGITVVTTEPINSLALKTGDGTKSGMVYFLGKTSGGSAIVAADVAAATPIGYIWPTTNGTANQFMQDSGTATCPTLATVSGVSPPATCHQMVWASGSAAQLVMAGGNTATFTGTSYVGFASLATRTNECVTGQGCGTAGVTSIAGAKVRKASVMQNFTLQMSGIQVTGTLTFNLRKNFANCGTPSTVSLLVPNASVAGFEVVDNTNTCTFADGDYMDWQVVQSTGTSGIVNFLSHLAVQ